MLIIFVNFYIVSYKLLRNMGSMKEVQRNAAITKILI